MAASFKLRNSIIFVTGGSGFLGRALLRRLSQYHPQTIRALVRSAEAEATVKKCGDQIVAVRGDLHDLDALRTGMDHATFVFHCAARVGDWAPYSEFERDTVIGTQNVVNVAKQQGVRRFVHVSTEAVLIDDDHKPLNNVDETHKVNEPSTTFPYSKSKQAAEKLVVAANTEEFNTIVVRPRLIWGAGDTVILPELVKVAKKGMLKYFNGGDYLTSICHVENVCEGMELAAEKGQPGQVYFLTDGEPKTIKVFWTALLQSQDVAPPTSSIPFRLGWYAAALLENLSWIFGKPAITRQAIALMGQNIVVNDSKARRELGYVGKKSFEDGVREMREEYLQSKNQTPSA